MAHKRTRDVQPARPTEPKPKMARLMRIELPKRATGQGNVLVCGQGDVGQLGLGDDESLYERKRPALVESIKNAVDVAAGGMHNLVLTDDGKVYSFGCNDEGALGRDCNEDGSEFRPELVHLPKKVLKISAGDSHSACLLEDGRVFAWGSFRDSHGNMGLTLEGNKRTPINVLPEEVFCAIASGADHLVMLSLGGKVYTVGCGEQGQLGRVSLRSASGESRRGKTELLRPGLVILKGRRTISEIWATNYCTFMRDQRDDTIWAAGLNNYKQLLHNKSQELVMNPVNIKLPNVKQIAGGQHHTIVLKTDGTCHVIGRCDYGRLGLGEVKEDLLELQQIDALADKKVVQVSCGEAQSFAVTKEGKLYAWGMGSNHQLGTGSEDDALLPVIIESKQTQGKFVLAVGSGGQHSIFLVTEKTEKNGTATDECVKEAVTLAATKVDKKKTAAAAEKEAKKAIPALASTNEPIDEINEQTPSITSKDSNLDVDVDMKQSEDAAAAGATASSTTTTLTNGKPSKRGRKK